VSRPFTRRQALLGGAGLALARTALAPTAVFGRTPPDHFSAAVALPEASASARGWITSKPVTARRPFDVIGARWSRARHVHVEVRVHQHGRWSRWLALPSGGDHGPDGARVEGTDPAWVGGARAFQMRVRGEVHGLRAHMVVAGPDPEPRARGTAAHQSGVPSIISRAQWGAARPKVAPAYGDVQMAFVHHTVSLNDYTRDESASIVRGIQRYHQDSNGWNDIGYNFLVDRYGQIFEGRSGGIDKAVIGAQSQGWNSYSTGVASLGTHTTEQVTPEGFEAIATIVAWKLSIHGVPTQGKVTITSGGGADNRYPAGTPVSFQRISGHRDGCATSCPGDALYAQIPALRTRASRLSFQTGLSVSLAHGKVAYRAATVVSGRLVLPDQPPSGGIGITVQMHTSRGWVALAQTSTAQDGSWRTPVSLPYTRTLRAIAAVPGQALLRSPSIRLEVKPKLAASLAHRAVSLRRRAVVRATISPARKRQKVTITVERRMAGGAYRRVIRVTTVVRSGRLSARLPLLKAGQHRITLSTARDRLNAAGRSKPVALRVH
jgi:hypothetical protein